MNQHEWMSSDDPIVMLNWVQDKLDARKLRLFACACCRHLLERFQDPVIRRTLEFAERLADGTCTKEELESLSPAFDARYNALYPGHGAPDPEALALTAVGDAAFASDSAVAAYSAMSTGMEAIAAAETICVPDGSFDERHDAVMREVALEYAVLLREVVGCPFTPPSRNPAWEEWNDQIIVKLAHSIYQSSNFGDLPILADALEECGNVDASLVHHCRVKEGHVRGCWALDCVRSHTNSLRVSEGL